MRWMMSLVMMAAVTAGAWAQTATKPAAKPAAKATAPAPAATLDPRGHRDSAASIAELGKKIMAQAAKNPDGLVSFPMDKYPGHYTMLTARTKSGGGEMHADFNDFLIPVEGEASIVIGGTIPDGKLISPGETRGTKVVGGMSAPMRKGDVIHILPNTPHQTVLKPGTTFLYYVIKVGATK